MQDPNANICDKAWSGALFAAGIIGPGGGYGQAAKGIKYGEKIIKQMGTRGWTQEAIETLIKNPAKTIDVTDTRHLPSGTQLNDPATAFINKDGSYVIRNNKTGDVVQVSNRNDPNWKAPWDK
ncbi:hypothetical protein KJ980_07190 [Patescibacteria group bacterium]|nr:hypothetical protein [Patescibacteria group bacterium]MBU4016971.1 hypothetical protein [Patescibacteria group bacterium]MBU4099406.1 hypothetical protein [Patescibacteria group bacterium]